MRTKIVSVLVYEDVEVLDFTGPFEVFNVAGLIDGLRCFDVYLTAQRHRPVMARGKLGIIPLHDYDDGPTPDILVVPGGPGSRRECVNEFTLQHIRKHHERGGTILSVCTGALIVAQAGIAQNLAAVTHQVGLGLLGEIDPSIRIHPDARIVDNGQLIFSAGVSAGIDASLYLTSRLFSRETAINTAKYMEYDWRYLDIDQKHIIRA